MSTTTPNLSLTLPTPNVDSGWGSTLNTDFTLIDNLFPADGSGTSVGVQVGTGKTLNAGGTIIAGGTLILGSGDGTGTVTAPTIRGAARTGTNVAGANITLDAANGTGTGGSGKFIFRTAPASGTPGSTANTMQTAMEIANTGVVSAPLGLTVGGVDIGTLLPVGTVLPYAGSSAPTNYLLCDGSAVSRTSYAALFAIVGTTYGVGDNSTTFNLPDLRGRIPAGKDDMGGTAASRLVNTRTVSVSTISRALTTCTVVTTAAHGLDTGNSITISGAGNVAFNGTWTVVSIISSTSFTFSTVSSGTIASVAGGTITVAIANGVNGATLGASGGLGTNTLTTGQMPLHGHPMRISPTSQSSVSSDTTGGFLLNNNADANFAAFTGAPADPAGQQIGGEGGSGPHNNVQPTLVLNYIIRT
jgi:microcystin-dependent protein